MAGEGGEDGGEIEFRFYTTPTWEIIVLRKRKEVNENNEFRDTQPSLI